MDIDQRWNDTDREKSILKEKLLSTTTDIWNAPESDPAVCSGPSR